MKVTCGIFTNIAPLYSRTLWYQLSASPNVNYVFFSSQHGFSGIRTINMNESKYIDPAASLNWIFIKNLFIKNILFYQIGILPLCFKSNFSAYILYGEMHSISNWLAAIICKMRRKPLLFWGHGFYGNEKFFKKSIRLLYYKLADYHLVYGNRSRNLMIESGFKPSSVFTVYNSLDFFTQKKIYEERNYLDLIDLKSILFPTNSEFPVVIFIGRLTREKKISYLLEALHLCKRRGHYINCLIVGGGTESETLKKLSESLDISESVNFYGPCYDEQMNAKLIMLSECCVSPGNVGLTAIHSLSFGTPVITHSNMFNQGPEAEAVIQNETGMFFAENDVQSLSNVMDDLILNKKKKIMEANCIRQVSEFWNPIKQTSVFDEAVLNSIKFKPGGR